jgi:uncharacterized protein YggE
VKNLKIPFFTIVFIFLGLFLYTKIAGPLPFSVYSVQTNKNDLFTTEGTGKATAIPDIATISIGITQNGITVSDVQEKINEASKKITDAIKKLGIEEKYIETTGYNIYPNYGRSGSQSITGYNATQNLEIKVKDIKKINLVVNTATAEGANLVSDVSFTFSDELRARLENKAREQAVASAKEKARSLAKVSGIRLGKLINVYESNYSPFRVNSPVGLGGAKMDSEIINPTNITPGEGTVNITVTLSYETY